MVESKKIYVNGEDFRIEGALHEVESFAETQKLSESDEGMLRLLSEEVLGLMSGITNDEYQALFWLAGNGREYELHLMGKTEMTAQRRDELLASARNGQNAAAVGIIGKIREMITISVLNWNDAVRIQNAYGGTEGMSFYAAGLDASMPGATGLTWTLSNYRDSLGGQMEEMGPDGVVQIGREPWDELERSVIANLADDVEVSIKDDHVEIIVYKTLEKGV